MIKELHAMGGTHVRVRGVEVRFDRVFVPLKPAEPSSLPVVVDGDTVSMSSDEVQAMRDELEHLRALRNDLLDQGVL